MADIVNSLFGLPSEDIRKQIYQEQQDFNTQLANTYGNEYDRRNALLGGMVGNAVANLGAGIFGVQDERLKRATTLESILQSTQQELGSAVNNPAILYPALQQRLAEAGFSREAMQVGQVGQKAIQEAQLNIAKVGQEQSQANKYKSETSLKNLEVQQKLLEVGSIPARAQVLKARIPELTDDQAKALASDPALLREVLKEDPEATQVVETQKGQILINKKTGKEIANLGPSPERGTKVNLNVNQTAETEYAKNVGKAVADKDVADIDKAQAVAATLPKMYETRQLLEAGDVTTGIGAEAVLVLQRARSKFLADKKAGKNVEDTQYLNALLGSDVFPQISALGIGARGLDTPAEREFLREVMTGTINLDANTLKRMTDLRIKSAEDAVDRYNTRLNSNEFEQYQRITGRQLSPVQVKKPALPVKNENKTSSGTKYKIIRN